MKPHSKLIEAATYFLNSSLMGYVKEFNVVASGMGNNTQDTACVSINIKMLDPSRPCHQTQIARLRGVINGKWCEPEPKKKDPMISLQDGSSVRVSSINAVLVIKSGKDSGLVPLIRESL